MCGDPKQNRKGEKETEKRRLRFLDAPSYKHPRLQPWNSTMD
uniref:Uncharacterized protein n=1 Tax=Arundo donax TaxID=35708 RepID=A0A0A9A3K2_ARUDO